MHVFWQVKKFLDYKYLSVFFFQLWRYRGRRKVAEPLNIYEGMGQLESHSTLPSLRLAFRAGWNVLKVQIICMINRKLYGFFKKKFFYIFINTYII